nr:hypothetical protein [Tanacetum cinerariifolium]
ESAEEETREEEEESFDLIPRTPEDSEDDDNGEEDQGLRVSEEQRLIKEEEADELYQDVDINQGRGLQVSQDIEDSHVTLTLVHPNGQQQSSSVLSFVTSMLNPISDVGVESIFTTASSSVALLLTPIPTTTPSITTASHPPIPPTPIPTVQIQTDRLHDSYQRENDEFLKTIDDNMKRIIKEQCNLPGSGISFLLVVGTIFTSSGKFFWQWGLYSWQIKSFSREDAFNHLAILENLQCCISSEPNHLPFVNNSPLEACRKSSQVLDPSLGGSPSLQA